jgi:hypothetical protein
MYFLRLIKEIINWIQVYIIVKRNEDQLLKSGLRVDWVGRMYTIINLPEEIATNEYARQPYIIGQLRKFDAVLLKYGLTESVFPDIEVIEDTYSYLLVLRPEREELFIWPFLKNLGIYIVAFFIIKVIYNVIAKNTQIVNSIVNFINEYII